MKTLITIGIAFLAIVINAQTLPCEPNCPTNSQTPPTSVPFLGEPLAIELTSSNLIVKVVNGDIYSDYVLERSDDLVTWTNVTPRFETDTNGNASFSFQATNAVGFFRLRDATLIGYAMPFDMTGSMPCGSFIGVANYRSDLTGNWGYTRDTNLTRHYGVDGGGRTNTIITYAGIAGDHGCGVFAVPVVPSQSDSGGFRFSILFPENVPDEPYALRLKGMLDE